MGGAISNPVDESTKREMQELIKSILVTFTTQYVKAYAIYLVKKLKMDAQTPPSDWKLLTRPENHDDLKSGWLSKEGGIRKTWKKRFFVVRWDYTVDYFDKEEESKKEKGKIRGSMGLAGYRVIEDVNEGVLKRATELAEKMGFNASEIPKPKEYPKFCFELNHWRRRCYLIQCENEEQRKEWVEMFKTACRCAYGLKNKEWVHEKAFHRAVRKTRWSLGRWGWWSYGGNEEQILSDLIADQIEWAIMGRIYSKINQGPWQVRNAIRGQVLKTLDTIISAGVGPAWKAMASTVETLRPQIEPKIKEVVDPIAKAEDEVTEKIKDAVMSVINPILQEHVTPHLGKIMEVIRSPMTEAYDVSFGLFDTQINAFEAKGNKTELPKTFRSLDYFPRGWQMWPSLEKVNVMYDPLWALNIIFKEIYPWGLIWAAYDDLRLRMDNAMYTFEQRLLKEAESNESYDGKALTETLKASVMDDYKEDAKAATLQYYAAIMKTIVMPPFQALVIPACETLLSPIESLVPDPVKDFIDVNDMFEMLLNKIIDASIATIVSS